MSKKIQVAELPDFDLAEHLKTDQDISVYLSQVLEDNDPSELTYALGVIARARGRAHARGAVQSAAPQLATALRYDRAGLPGVGVEADNPGARVWLNLACRN